MNDAQAPLRRSDIRRLFKKHRGSVREVARRANVSHPVVSAWLRDRTTSDNVARAAEELARELIEQERRAAA